MIVSLNTSLEMRCIGSGHLKISLGLDKLAMRMAAVVRFGKAFKPLETGSDFSTELEWVGDLEDLAKSEHTIARYIRSLVKPDETLFEAAIRLS